MKVTLPRKFHF